MEVFEDKLVKVRKGHVCLWCAEAIPTGEEAHYRAYMWEGDFNSDYMHQACYKAMLRAPYDLVEEGILEGMFKRGSTDLSETYA